MADRFTGVWNGEEVRFKREWRGITLTEQQCQDLCDGKIIEVVGLVSAKTGNPYGVTAKLGHQVAKASGDKYVGVEQVDFLTRAQLAAHGIKLPVPKVFLQHEFTEDEYLMLESGHKVHIDDAYSQKRDSHFACTVKYDEDQQKIVIDSFDK